MRFLLSAGAAGLLALSLPAPGRAGESPSVSEDAPPEPIARSVVPYTVAVLDRVTVRHRDGSSETLQVSQDGTLDLDGKTCPVKGLAPADLTSLVQRRLGGASVQIHEFRTNRVTVLGEVFHQIYTEMSDGPMRVMDAIASANGFTPLANLRRVKLVRENAGQVEVYELDLRQVMKGRQVNQNMLLEPGDVITVPRNFL